MILHLHADGCSIIWPRTPGLLSARLAESITFNLGFRKDDITFFLQEMALICSVGVSPWMHAGHLGARS